MKLWAGRFTKEENALVNDFNSSISFDCRMYKQDIQGSIAHATMLGDTGIIPKSESEKIVAGLKEILADIQSGKLPFDWQAEDIHMFIEAELTRRLGETGKRLHTARSRNDQVAVDIRLYLKEEISQIMALARAFIAVLLNKAQEHAGTILPGVHPFAKGAAHHLWAPFAGVCVYAAAGHRPFAGLFKTHECNAAGVGRFGRHHLPD